MIITLFISSSLRRPLAISAAEKFRVCSLVSRVPRSKEQSGPPAHENSRATACANESPVALLSQTPSWSFAMGSCFCLCGSLGEEQSSVSNIPANLAGSFVFVRRVFCGVMNVSTLCVPRGGVEGAAMCACFVSHDGTS